MNKLDKDWISSNEVLQIEQEVVSLLVWHAAEGIIRVDSLEVWNQVGQGVGGTEGLHAVLQGFVPNDGLEVSGWLSVHLGVDSSFQIHSEAFIEPEVFPSSVGDEVSSPAVRNFVSNDISVGAVSSQEGGCHKSQARVFHTTVRERWRQQQHIVISPDVFSNELLSNLQELFSLGEFKGTSIHHGFLRPHFGSWTNLSVLQSTNTQSNQIGGHWDVLLESECFGLSIAGGTSCSVCTHDCS
mmetsp:Transcript_29219/g.41127  ORF Transcript_29219/g.41127 Transcript_29219/m.41127 type:complete len:241 (-) Transcript_29219:549-1271(-)